MPSIVFTTSPGLISRIVRAVTRSPTSHVGVALDWHGHAVVLHAYGRGGVQVDTRRIFLDGRRVVAEFRLPEGEPLDPILGVLGRPYDWRGILGFVLPFMPGARNAYVCSELVARLRVFDGERRPDGRTHPGHLLTACERLGLGEVEG
jgi:hypothetical protein